MGRLPANYLAVVLTSVVALFRRQLRKCPGMDRKTTQREYVYIPNWIHCLQHAASGVRVCDLGQGAVLGCGGVCSEPVATVGVRRYCALVRFRTPTLRFIGRESGFELNSGNANTCPPDYLLITQKQKR